MGFIKKERQKGKEPELRTETGRVERRLLSEEQQRGKDRLFIRENEKASKGTGGLERTRHIYMITVTNNRSWSGKMKVDGQMSNSLLGEWLGK